MKKSAAVLTVFLLLMLNSSSCSGNDEMETIFNNYLDSMEQMITDVQRANDHEAITEAINNYADRLEQMMPQLKKYMDLNPGFNFQQWNLDDKMKDKFAARLQNITEIQAEFSQKTSQFEDHERVKTALLRIEKINARLAK